MNLSLTQDINNSSFIEKPSPTLYKSEILNKLSKETLEIIRKVTSNKPTPSPALSFAFANKRVNSGKPTPSLESKLMELRNATHTDMNSLQRRLE